MALEDSVTEWLASLKTQDDEAARRLYHRYVEQLKAFARKKLRSASRRVADEEDIANLALTSVFQGIREGRFHKLGDRNDLWQVLMMLADRKAIDQLRREGSQKRGGGRVRGESALDNSDKSESRARGIEQIVDQAPTPEGAAVLVEEFEHRIKQLDNSELREIAVAKMQGETSAEIAHNRRCTLRTIERKLLLIRKIWQQE